MNLRNYCILFVLALSTVLAPSQHLTLTNLLAIDRPAEVVEVPLTQALKNLHLTVSQNVELVARDRDSGERIPLQLYANEPSGQPNLLLLLIQLHAHESRQIVFSSDPQAAPLSPLVFGREVPERKDDFAWENEQVTYRIYGPALQAAGEITSGIDAWSKRIPNFVIDRFYKRDLEGIRTHNPALSYHKDNGQGLDSYDVGPSRGCGGTAVWSENKLIASKNYIAIRRIANGPIRFAFEVDYAPWDVNGTSVRETKRVVLDAGTYLNKISSTYTFTGAEKLELAAGLAIHEGARASFPVPDQIAAVWDMPQDASAGHIATGLIAAPDQQAHTRQVAGHALLTFSRHSGEAFVYYAGSAWSKANMPTTEAWEAYLRQQQLLLEHPIQSAWVQ
jgi:hypothetical protein